MKFFHISDLHIGCRLYNRDLREDQMYVFEQVIEACKREKPQVLAICGDIYDKAVPSAEAVDLYNWFVSRLYRELPGMEVLAISGNHDSASRLSAYQDLLPKARFHISGHPPFPGRSSCRRPPTTMPMGRWCSG